jgi:translation initiation factor IF-2
MYFMCGVERASYIVCGRSALAPGPNTKWFVAAQTLWSCAVILLLCRKRKLKQRIQEIKNAGVKSHAASDLKTLHAQAHLQEQQQLKAAAGSSSSSGAASLAGAADHSTDAEEDGNTPADSAAAAAAAVAAEAEDAGPVLPPDAPTVTFIVKGDVQGSVEAVLDAITAAAAGRAAVRYVYSGVGPISTSDVHLAATTGARIIAFNIATPSGDVEGALRSSRVEVMRHNVIYHLLDEVAAVITASEAGGAAGPAGTLEEVLGSALVLAVFPMIKNRQEVGKVAGCRVQEGSLSSGSGVLYRVLREGHVVFEGPLSSLKQQRSAVAAVGKGNECGVALDEGTFGDYQPGDVVQCVQRRTARS